MSEPRDRESAEDGRQESAEGGHGESADDGHRRDGTGDEFGRAGWLLVAALAIALVVVPLVIYVRPPGVPFVVAYLVLPLLPAVLLALLAVWVTTRP